MNKHAMRTYTGRMFSFAEITPEDIDIRDIAHALSHLCRFVGHTSMFYSVAQHCLLVSEKIPGGPEVKLAALLHDAAEAYVNDLPSPLKRWLGEAYVGDMAPSFGDDTVDIGPEDESYTWLHNSILEAIYKKYGIACVMWGEIKAYDKAAQQFEQEAFMGASLVHIEPWSPWNPQAYAASLVEGEFGQVEAEFLKRFEDLMTACGREHLV